jgi:tRNA G26 N,N-dimethylase Trm1
MEPNREEEGGCSMVKIVYWIDEKTGAYVELAGSEWDGDLSDEELLARALQEAREAGLDLSYGKILIEEEVGE